MALFAAEKRGAHHITTVIETYDIAEPLIKVIREHINSETTYQEVEWLVKRWKASLLKKNK